MLSGRPARRRPGGLVVLFRAPAGPRRGFGHLLRCRALARALGAAPLVSVRGTTATRRVARRLGVRLVTGGPAAAIRATGAGLVVVDDVIDRQAARWIRGARRAGVPSASVHDLGLGCLDADLLIDGGVVRSARLARRRALTGPRYAVLDPSFARVVRRRRASRLRVLVALGGGPRAHLVRSIAEAIADCVPRSLVRAVGGFGFERIEGRSPSVAWVGPRNGLRRDLQWCDVAVVAGGVTAYEACASGAAVVALPVVAAQVPTIDGLAMHGACVGVMNAAAALLPARVSDAVARLFASPSRRTALGVRARQLVDGRGAYRVAARLRDLADRGRP